MRRTAFDNFHPAVPALYYAFILVYCMTAFHPVLVALSLASALAVNAYLRGAKAAARTASWQLPLMLLIAVVNPILSASGSTLLFMLWSHPIYLESFIYGLCMGGMLMAAMLWFSNASHIMTSENVMTLLGSRLPVVGLMISMTMRLVPQFVRRGQLVGSAANATTAASAANAAPSIFAGALESKREVALGDDSAACDVTSRAATASRATGEDQEGSPTASGKKARLASHVRNLSVLMGWSLEDSLETSDAMRARGWGGCPSRTTYQRRALSVVDVAFLVMLCALMACVVAITVAGCSGASFYPTVVLGSWWWVAALAYMVVLAIPAILEVREWLAWR